MSSPGRARLGTNSRIWMTSSKTANSRGWARTRAAINWSRTSCCGDRATADLRPPGGIEDLRWQLLQQRCGAHRRAHRRLPRPGRTRAALHRPPGLSRCMESVTKQRELAEVGGPSLRHRTGVRGRWENWNSKHETTVSGRRRAPGVRF